jgi:hypothetical protein
LPLSEIYNVKDYGAAGDRSADDSTAFQKVIDAIASEGKGVMYIPRGDYVIRKQIVRLLANWDIAIIGDGMGVSNLYCDNSDGIFQFTHKDKLSQCTIRDLSFYAARPGAGTAINIEFPVKGNRHNRSLIAMNIEMRGNDIQKDYFIVGIRGYAQWRPLYWNCIFSGPYGPGSDANQFSSDYGIFADESYAPTFQNCYIWSTKTAFSINSEHNPGPEGCFFYNCFAVGCLVGMDINTPGIEPGTAIDRCHINCRDYGIRMKRKYFSITNCLFYNSLSGRPEDAPPYNDIYLDSCTGVVIAHNIFHQPTNANRRGIAVSGRSRDILINGNYFNFTGIAVAVAAAASNVNCANNEYTDNITAPLVDESASAAVYRANRYRGVLVNLASDLLIASRKMVTVSWQEAQYDTDSFWKGADGLVVPANRGIRFVRLTANAAWDEKDSGLRSIQFTKNGDSGFIGNGRLTTGASGTSELHVQSGVIPVAAGDVLGVQVMQSSGKPLALKACEATWFLLEVVEG